MSLSDILEVILTSPIPSEYGRGMDCGHLLYVFLKYSGGFIGNCHLGKDVKVVEK
jgi:hypothetical protein